MATFKITATTTDEQIKAATKEQLICATFTGSAACLRDHKRRTWSKTTAIEQAQNVRNSLQTERTGLPS